jgi:hypothetical protein
MNTIHIQPFLDTIRAPCRPNTGQLSRCPTWAG